MTPDISNPFYYWLSGALIGFHLREKLPRWLQKAWRLLAILAVLSGAGYLARMARNVSAVDLGSRPTRLLSKVETSPPSATGAPIPMPPFEILKRLHKESSDREREGKVTVRDLQLAAEIEIKRNEAKREKVIAKQQQQAQKADAQSAFPSITVISGQAMICNNGGTCVVSSSSGTVTTSNSIMVFSSGGDQPQAGTPVGTRKGPFCRITCLVHHADSYTPQCSQPRSSGGSCTYDVETDKEYCDKDRIPPDAAEVPGWTTQGNMEFRQPWPGPANPDGGFDSYKLYWKK